MGVRAGGLVSGWTAGKSLARLYLRKRKELEVDAWYGYWLVGVGVPM